MLKIVEGKGLSTVATAETSNTRSIRDRERNKMSSDAKKSGNGGGGFRARLDHYLYSGEKKHVFAGIAIFGVIFGVPWYFMTRGTKHQSHQDYMDKADKARSARLSTGSATTK